MPSNDRPTPTTGSTISTPPVSATNNSSLGRQNPSLSTGPQVVTNGGATTQSGSTPTTTTATNANDAAVAPANTNSAQNGNGGASASSTPALLPSLSETIASSSIPLAPTAAVAGSSSSKALKSGSTSADDRLSNGAVAGVVIAVALGLALLTFLVTFFIMRQNKGSKKERQMPIREDPVFTDNHQKGPLMTATSRGSDSLMSSMPQSADDTTIRQSVEATLDQIRLYIENFYQETPTSRTGIHESELKSFDSSFLPAPLTVILPQAAKATPILKHTLSNLVTTSISPTGIPAQSLLPAEFVLLPSKTKSSKSSTSKTPEFRPCLSRWQQLTAYLLPNPLEDVDYREYRNRRIDNMVRGFTRVFGPWENPQYGSDQRSNSLSAIFKGASELGILLFSQPSEFQFRWPNNGNSEGPNQLAVTPTLVKTTDEQGARLHAPQVLVEAECGRFS